MMIIFYISNVFLWLTVLFSLTSSLGAVAKKTKLCGDEACTVKLFEGKFHRSSIANHESFLSPNVDDVVNVYAIKFSDRTDLMEGALVREPEIRGNFFTMHINLDGYVDFLKNAILSNKTMYMISMDPYDLPGHRLIGVKSALPELIKDYEVNSKRLADEKQLPPPEPIDYAALGYFPDDEGHGHSHTHGHGHSHDHAHSHSHSHLHEHIQPEQNTQQPVVPPAETALPPPPVANSPQSIPSSQQVPTVTDPIQNQNAPEKSPPSSGSADVRPTSNNLDDVISEPKVTAKQPSSAPPPPPQQVLTVTDPKQQQQKPPALIRPTASSSDDVPPEPKIVPTHPSQPPPPPISISEQTSGTVDNLPQFVDMSDINFTETRFAIPETSSLPSVETFLDGTPEYVPPQRVNVVDTQKISPSIEQIQPVPVNLNVHLEGDLKRVTNFPESPPNSVNTPSSSPGLQIPSQTDLPQQKPPSPPPPPAGTAVQNPPPSPVQNPSTGNAPPPPPARVPVQNPPPPPVQNPSAVNAPPPATVPVQNPPPPFVQNPSTGNIPPPPPAKIPVQNPPPVSSIPVQNPPPPVQNPSTVNASPPPPPDQSPSTSTVPLRENPAAEAANVPVQHPPPVAPLSEALPQMPIARDEPLPSGPVYASPPPPPHPAPSPSRQPVVVKPPVIVTPSKPLSSAPTTDPEDPQSLPDSTKQQSKPATVTTSGLPALQDTPVVSAPASESFDHDSSGKPQTAESQPSAQPAPPPPPPPPPPPLAAASTPPPALSDVKVNPESDVKNAETTTDNLPQKPPSPPPVVAESSVLETPPPDPASASGPSAAGGIRQDEKGTQEETGKQPENVEIGKQTKDEVKTNIVEEDGLGYCMKDECDKVYATVPVTQEGTKSGYLLVIGKYLTKLIGIVRFVLPSQIKDIDDAGVVVTFFVPICLIVHLVRVLIFADNSDREIFDRRTLHNALTAVREREVQMKLLHIEAEKGKNAMNAERDKKFESLQSEMGDRLLEIQQLKTKCRNLEEENDNLKAESDETNQMVEKERLKSRELTKQNQNLEEKNEMLTKQLAEVQLTLETMREENERLDDELTERNAQLTRLESDANSYKLEMKNLRDQLKTSLAESKILHKRVEELQNETVQLSEIINEMRDSGNVLVADNRSSVTVQSGKSEQIREDGNGESGWSDFDEFDVDNSPSAAPAEKSKKERSPIVRSSPADIMEVARLRAQLKNMEADLDQAKLTLQKQENEREHLMRKVELAESDAAKRLKEVETKEAERVEAHNQFKRILAMVEEREAKLRNTEEVMEKLRGEVSKWQEEVRQLEDRKKAVELKLMEADQELKRLKSEYARLETRNFHEVRECKQTIAALQQSLEQARLANPSANMLDNTNLLNLSASSSDRDYSASLTGGLVAPPLPHIRPLWDDEPPEMFSTGGGETSLLRGTGPLLNDRVPENGGMNYKHGARARRSIRDRERNNGTAAADGGGGTQPRHKKEGRRMRSRSQGRHPLHMDYYPGLTIPGAYPPPPQPTGLYNSSLLNRQRSKSGTLYYSSGGSNDGRSPPPEIALLSGIPPPGPMIKKPMPRPKSSTEPVERRQS